MAARAGLTTILERWRRLVYDGGSAVWTDDQAQTFVDDHNFPVYQAYLAPIARQTGPGTVLYSLYQVPNRGPIEGTASGTAVWRLYDSTGSAIAGTAYTLDAQSGLITFTANQAGSARYADYYEVDLYGAAADALDERAASAAALVDFQSDDQKFSTSQGSKQWSDQAAKYRALSWPVSGTLWRSDVAVGGEGAYEPVGPYGFGPSY